MCDKGNFATKNSQVYKTDFKFTGRKKDFKPQSDTLQEGIYTFVRELRLKVVYITDAWTM